MWVVVNVSNGFRTQCKTRKEALDMAARLNSLFGKWFLKQRYIAIKEGV